MKVNEQESASEVDREVVANALERVVAVDQDQVELALTLQPILVFD